ncbi:DUF4397 domain-containing protein [Pseudonocardia pini]|uniref:DUF4397 domain-containing protein n=1 Tax=Pseudonocardia pini TaxID=2758030 RepID=UPI0015F0C968|nr:DUF4397 domain-containing protein [Pseudonocardia pini]
MRRLVLAACGVLAACATAVATAPAASAQETGSVHVVHGIPDTPVDVYVDGQRALDDFAPNTTAGPVDLPAGTRAVVIVAADAADASTPLLSAEADVPAGGDVTLVAHLDASGKPTVTPFVDDVSAVPAGQARLVVRHTAAAPAVDVLANGSPALTGLTNPNQAAAEVPAGTLTAAVAAAGTTAPVIGPADLTLAEGTATFVHAVGSLQQNSLQLVSFTVDGLHSAPNGVPAGAPSGAPGQSGISPLVGAVAGMVLIGLGVAALRRGRATRS